MQGKAFLRFNRPFQANPYFYKRDLPSGILRYPLDLLGAKQAGFLYGTDESNRFFLPPRQWDRGIIHRFQGRGITGFFLKIFLPYIMRVNGISPIHMYDYDTLNGKINAKGIIAYVLRTYVDFYQKGFKVLLVCDIPHHIDLNQQGSATLPVISFDGREFVSMGELCVNVAIIRQFIPENFIAAYVPDFGALLINTVDKELLSRQDNAFVHESELGQRLRQLVQFVEEASMIFLSSARGRKATKILWRKEKKLREVAFELAQKEIALDRQKAILLAVGGVTEEVLSMDPVLIHDGVYAFVDMVGSARIQQTYNPRDYFYISNCCRQIAAHLAVFYSCRLGNYLGDGIFFQNVSVFDIKGDRFPSGLHERVVLMTLFIAAFFKEIDLLAKGQHSIDPSGRVKMLLKDQRQLLLFRSGIEAGPATIGPVGTKQRMIITAIGEGVDLAARLETTGVPDEIHLSSKVVNILRETWISSETKKVYALLSGKYSYTKEIYSLEYAALHKAGKIRFLDMYKLGFKDSSTVLRRQTNICHKEFVPDKTYLLKWRKEKGDQAICCGI